MNERPAGSTLPIDPGLMRLCLWSGIALVAMTAIGFGWMMHYVPPPKANWTSGQIYAFVKAHQLPILVGATLCCFFWSFWVTWAAPVILFIRKMERAPLLTFASLANVGGGAAVITCIAVSWTVMAFRVDDPVIVQAFNDCGFFLFLYTWPPFGIWMFIIGVAILRDVNPEPTFPRWVAFYNFWTALLMAPASLMGLFKTGPFAYDGLLSFWLVALDFFSWMVVMSIVTFGVIAREERRMAGRVAASGQADALA